MIVVFHWATQFMGVRYGYFVGFAVYWSYCIGVVFLVVKSRGGLARILKRPDCLTKRCYLYILLAFLPVPAVFCIQFLPHLDVLYGTVILMASGNAIINGTVEELYWRGLYLDEFEQHASIGIWLSTLLFGAWHIALYSIRDIEYGGFWPLVGGAACMGLLWSYCSRRLKSIVPAIIAHILVNIFAFTGLYIEK